MYQEELKLSYGEGKYKIYVWALMTTDGFSVTLTGGEKPHVGGVAIAIPRVSLTKCNSCDKDNTEGKIEGITEKVTEDITEDITEDMSCDTWLSPVPGHKDIHVAGPSAEKITRATGQKTVVVAGIHIDNGTSEEIQQLLENCQRVTDILIEEIKKAGKV